MLPFCSIWQKRFLLIAFMLLIASARISAEQNLQPSEEPELSPGPSYDAEPSVEPVLPPMSLSALVDLSYMRHVDFIRQGLPMSLVKSFYNHAFKEAAGPGCIQPEDDVVLGKCTTPLFDENDGYAVKSLHQFISQEKGRPVQEKYFPDMLSRTDLPVLTDEENSKVSDAKSETLQRLSLGATNGWDISVFPTDEEIRYDPGRDVSCEELADKMPYYGLTMTASSLTAYVLGMAAQLIVGNADSPQARMILDNHVKLMYLSARCNRLSGDNLEVPTVHLRELISRAELALLARPKEESETSLPSFEFMKDIVDGSKHFFGEEIERMSSMNSFGRIKYITWTGDSVSCERLDSRIAAKTSLQTMQEYYEEMAASSSEPDLPCSSGYSYQRRLSEHEEEDESCCAETCIVTSGRRLDLFIVNEMCCLACNEENCDLSKLSKVIQVEAFRFARSA